VIKEVSGIKVRRPRGTPFRVEDGRNDRTTGFDRAVQMPDVTRLIAEALPGTPVDCF